MIAYPLAFAIEHLSLGKKRKVPLILWLLPTLVWLAFLPNACYLFTEWRHFLLDPDYRLQRSTNSDDAFAVLSMARQSIVFIIYSAAGAFSFGLSIRPMAALVKRWNIVSVACASIFYLLVSMGVYLGLVVRLNSWDLATHPHYVLHTIKHAITTPNLVITITVFAFCLWVLYTILDIWFDGLILRWKALTKSRG